MERERGRAMLRMEGMTEAHERAAAQALSMHERLSGNALALLELPAIRERWQECRGSGRIAVEQTLSALGWRLRAILPQDAERGTVSIRWVPEGAGAATLHTGDARTMADMLEFTARAGTGDFRFHDHPAMSHVLTFGVLSGYEDRLRRELFPELDGLHGQHRLHSIRSPQVHPDAKAAWELHCVIRHRLARMAGHENGAYAREQNPLGDAPLPTLREASPPAHPLRLTRHPPTRNGLDQEILGPHAWN